MTEQSTRSNIPIKPLYTPEDAGDMDYRRDLNDPGGFPFTRGRRAHTGGAWIQRELSGEGEPYRSNRQLKYLIEKGQTGIDVIGDSPTQAYTDPDHPLALYTAGTQGVSMCRIEDYRELLEGIPLDTITVSSSIPPAFTIAGLYLVAREQGLSPPRPAGVGGPGALLHGRLRVRGRHAL